MFMGAFLSYGRGILHHKVQPESLCRKAHGWSAAEGSDGCAKLWQLLDEVLLHRWPGCGGIFKIPSAVSRSLCPCLLVHICSSLGLFRYPVSGIFFIPLIPIIFWILFFLITTEIPTVLPVCKKGIYFHGFRAAQVREISLGRLSWLRALGSGRCGFRHVGRWMQGSV